MPVSVIMPNAEREATAPYRLTILNRYDDAEKCFLRIVTFYNYGWKLTPDGPYTAMMTTKKSLVEQFSDAFPGIPMDEWESLAHTIDDAHDIVSMEEAWMAFLDIYYEYDLADL